MLDARYINEFLYAVVSPEAGTDALVWCSGVNLDRFNRITRGRFGQSSNPVVRGLQRVRYEVIRLALSRDAAPESVKGGACSGLSPVPAETWYTETLRIRSASGLPADELVSFTVTAFLEKIALSGMIQGPLPSQLPDPGGLQSMFEGLTASDHS